MCVLIFLDINECLENTHGCNHICNNQNGSYYCTCNHSGYRLDADQKTCIGKVLSNCSLSHTHTHTPSFHCIPMAQTWMNVQKAPTNAIKYAAIRWEVTSATVIQDTNYCPTKRLASVRSKNLLLYLFVLVRHRLFFVFFLRHQRMWSKQWWL